MSLGQRVRELRQARGLTQSQLGGPEISKSLVSLIERDRTRPSIETLLLIARRLGTSVDELLGRSGHIPAMVADSLLTLSREAIRTEDFARASRLIDSVNFLASTYALEEASREARLQAAQIALAQRAFAEAWSTATEVSASSEAAKDFWRLGRALLLMGWVKVRQREFPKARTLLEQALLMLRRARAGRDPARVEALIALGTTLVHMGEFQVAVRRYREAANSEVVRHNTLLRGRALWGIGLAYRKLGNQSLAREYLSKARDVMESAEELPDLMRVLHNLGQLFYEEGQAKEALRHLHHALRVMDRLEKPDRASILAEIGRVHLSLNNLQEAQHFTGRALEEAKKLGDFMEVGEAQVLLARISLFQSSPTTAVRLLEEAVTIFRERGMHAKMMEAAKELGLLLREHGAHAKAASYLALALGKAQQESKPVKSGKI